MFAAAGASQRTNTSVDQGSTARYTNSNQKFVSNMDKKGSTDE
jgi:hypothetical protein